MFALTQTHLLSLHDDGLRQRVVASLLVGKALKIIQLRLQLENEILLFFPLCFQTFPLLPLTLTGEKHKQSLEILQTGGADSVSITTLKQHVTNRHQCGRFASINKRKFCSQHFPVKMKRHKKAEYLGHFKVWQTLNRTFTQTKLSTRHQVSLHTHQIALQAKHATGETKKKGF